MRVFTKVMNMHTKITIWQWQHFGCTKMKILTVAKFYFDAQQWQFWLWQNFGCTKITILTVMKFWKQNHDISDGSKFWQKMTILMELTVANFWNYNFGSGNILDEQKQQFDSGNILGVQKIQFWQKMEFFWQRTSTLTLDTQTWQFWQWQSFACTTMKIWQWQNFACTKMTILTVATFWTHKNYNFDSGNIWVTQKWQFWQKMGNFWWMTSTLNLDTQKL